MDIYRPWSAASSHESCYCCFIYFPVMSSENAQYRCSFCRIHSWRYKVSITQPFDMWPSFDCVPDVLIRRLSANIVNLAQIGALNSHNTQTQGTSFFSACAKAGISLDRSIQSRPRSSTSPYISSRAPCAIILQLVRHFCILARVFFLRAMPQWRPHFLCGLEEVRFCLQILTCKNGESSSPRNAR